MKTIFTLFASLLLSIAVFAAAKPQGILTIRSADNSDIRIVLDGKRFESNDNAITIRGIEKGQHTIKVFRQKRNGIFNLIGKGYELVYQSTVQVKNNTHQTITIERNGRAVIQQTRVDRNWNYNGRDFDYGRDGKWGDYDQHEAYARGMSDREFRSVMN